MGRRRRTSGELQAEVVRVFRPGSGADLPSLRRPQVHRGREEDAQQASGRRKIGKADYQAQGVLYLPEKARFGNLLNLPEGTDIGKAINEAMKAIEAENEDLKDVLPKTYNSLDKTLLVSLLKNFSAIPMTIEGDAFGKIYEYFLGKFAMAEGQKGGEFFTPTSIVKLIVEIIEPFHGRILDPACWFGRHVRPVGGVRRTPQEERQRDLDLRAGESCRDHPALQDEPCRPRSLWRHPAGDHLLRRHSQERRQVRLRDGESAVQRGQGGQGADQGRSTLSVRVAEGRQRQLSLDSDLLQRAERRRDGWVRHGELCWRCPRIGAGDSAEVASRLGPWM